MSLGNELAMTTLRNSTICGTRMQKQYEMAFPQLTTQQRKRSKAITAVSPCRMTGAKVNVHLGGRFLQTYFIPALCFPVRVILPLRSCCSSTKLARLLDRSPVTCQHRSCKLGNIQPKCFPLRTYLSASRLSLQAHSRAANIDLSVRTSSESNYNRQCSVVVILQSLA